jgi:hypothetical protein
MGSVDEIGNYEDTIRQTAKMVGIKGEPQGGNSTQSLAKGFRCSISSVRPGWGSFFPSVAEQLGEIDTSVKFKYQWK